MEKNNVMTPEKSLEIISEMMNQGRKDTQLVFGKFMISWGILIILVAMIVGYLWKTRTCFAESIIVFLRCLCSMIYIRTLFTCLLFRICLGIRML